MINLGMAGLGQRRRTPKPPRVHVNDPKRSEEWNAWRRGQAVAPQPVTVRGFRRHRPAAPVPAATLEHERRSARNSTRASRRRTHRARSNELAGRQQVRQS